MRLTSVSWKEFTLHATRRTSHDASRLVQAMSVCLVKTRPTPLGHSRDARVYGHTTTAMHKLSPPTPFPPYFFATPLTLLLPLPLPLPLPLCQQHNGRDSGSVGWGPPSPGDSGAGGGGGGGKGGRRKLDKQRLMTAVLLNRNIMEYSSGARLVVTNLPLVADMHASEVLQYVDAVGASIAPLLMIRGAGVEVVTQYG